jgi:DNA-binding LacI/PurR family transcriptional regulator
VDHLLQKGFRKLGLVVGEDYDRHRNYRISASFRAALHHHKIKTAQAICSSCDPEAVVKWAAAYQPDAILFRYPESISLLEKEKTVPALFSIDRMEDNTVCPGVEQPWRTMGQESITLLASLISQNERGIPDIRKNITLPAQWVDQPDVPLSKP